jgi:hypothetical protein
MAVMPWAAAQPANCDVKTIAKLARVEAKRSRAQGYGGPGPARRNQHEAIIFTLPIVSLPKTFIWARCGRTGGAVHPSLGAWISSATQVR